MSWPEKQTILFVLFVSCVLVTSDIYKSVMWTTNNPLFSDSGKLSHCFGEDLEMRVHLQSSLPIVCPFDFIIMKTLASKPATGVLYENFWIVYDYQSFNSCDINMTYYKDGNPKDRNRKLLECDSPEALKSFTYSIDFKAKTPANSGISFVGGEYYYFLATSDGTDGSLNNTRGGHCNDPKVRMKFKVYICKTHGVDKKCQNVSIGEFLCPSDLPEAATTSTPTTSTPTTVTSQPSTPITTDSKNSTNTVVLSPGNSGTILPTMTTVVAPSTTSTSSDSNNTTDIGASAAPRQGSQDVLNELSRWKTVAIVSFGFWVLLVFVIIVVWYIKRRKEKPGLCFTDLNRVTPPAKTEPPSPDSDYTKTPNLNNSFNNVSYSHEDSEDGKSPSHNQEMDSIKQNIPPTPAVDKPDEQTQEKNDTQEKELPEKSHPGMKNEIIGNGTYGGKESGERKQHKHKHKHKDKNRNSEVGDVLSLPPLKDGVVLKKYSPSPERRRVEVNGGYLYEDHV